MAAPTDLAGGQATQSLHVELYVPHDAPAGTHRGTLTLTLGPREPAPDGEPDGLGLHAARPPQLPARDELLRPAGERARLLPPGASPPDGAQPAALQPERADRRRAAPAAGTASGSTGRAWDRRFGPLLDGSAFADLPRKGVPVECFYLPLHENWPSPMEGNYNGSYWADQAFPESYRQAFVAASRQIAEHFRARGWNDTLFHGFLNNKNNFKANGWSRGSSPWLLDEPASFQDYWALRYFARAFHEGINQARPRPTAARPPASFPRLVFRADISRPQWRRDALDGLLDYHVVGSAMRQYPRLVFDRKRTLRRDRRRVRRHEPGARARTSSRSAGASTPGRWGPTAFSPGRRSATATRGSRPTSSRSSTRLPARDPPRGKGPAWSPRSDSRRIAAASRTSST